MKSYIIQALVLLGVCSLIFGLGIASGSDQRVRTPKNVTQFQLPAARPDTDPMPYAVVKMPKQNLVCVFTVDGQDVSCVPIWQNINNYPYGH